MGNKNGRLCIQGRATNNTQGDNVALSRQFEEVPGARIEKLIFLGTGSAVPSPGYRNTSGMAFVLSTGKVILCDCGEATQHQMMRSSSIKMHNIDLVLLTHLHGDHFFGIFGMILTMGNLGREEPLTIVGPAGVKNAVLGILEAQGGFYSYKLHFVELHEGGSIDLGMLTDGCQVSAHPLDHRVPAFGYVIVEPDKPGALDAKKAKALGASGKQLGELKAGRDVVLENGTLVQSKDCLGPCIKGKKVVILQDTQDSKSAYEAAQDCDLLIHEATYDHALEEKAKSHGHSTSAMAGLVAKELNSKVLVLTHFSPRYTTLERSPKEDHSAAPTATPSVDYIEELVHEAALRVPGVPIYAAADFLVLTTTKTNAQFHVPEKDPYDLKETDPSYSTYVITESCNE